jgi:O-methyltransferase involved in polyketide biosynthesis
MAEKIALTGTSETLLATLYARAQDSVSQHPILGDTTAAEITAHLDVDYSRLHMRPTDIIGVAMRAKVFDRWTREFLAHHHDAVVLHLGCGLDSRAERVNPTTGVQWFDIDLPEVIDLRHRLYPPRPGYTMIPASVTDPGWLVEIPRTRPTLIVGEGLTMYLPTSEGPPLLRRLVAHIDSGEMAFDFYSRLAVRLASLVPVLRHLRIALDWGVSDPHELEHKVPGLRLVSSLRSLEAADPADLAALPWKFRAQLNALAAFPYLRNAGHISRYSFGEQ